MDLIQQLLQQNAVFTGMAGAAILGFMLVQLRSMPERLWKLFLRQFTVTLKVHNEDNAFRTFAKWLADHPSAQKTRSFSVVEWHNAQLERDEVALTPGEGYHILREGARFYVVRREIQEAQQGAAGFGRPREYLTISTLGRSRKAIQDLLDKARDAQDMTDRIPISMWMGGMNGYKMIERRRKRPLDTIYLPQALKDEVVDDIERFLAAQEDYAYKAIPWRRGFLLDGPPGTGKTSFIVALASRFNRALHIISPGRVYDDAALLQAINDTGEGFVVIEDIDDFDFSHQRTEEATPGKTLTGEKGGLTLSGLLNAIDGIASREGRVLFISSNHPDKLDAALLRPGRIDKRIFLPPAGENEVKAMFDRFHPGADPADFLAALDGLLPLPASAIQSRLLEGQGLPLITSKAA